VSGNYYGELRTEIDRLMVIYYQKGISETLAQAANEILRLKRELEGKKEAENNIRPTRA
jgi:hypothetical protein